MVCGTTTLFWKDLWRDEIVQNSHPRAYSFSLDEDISVRDFLGTTALDEAFHLSLSPQAHEELKELQTLTTIHNQ